MQSINTEYFEDMYAADPDPWRFASSSYEAEKYSDTLRAVEGRIYDNVLEVGCSIGVLTSLLSNVSRRLTAIDVSHLALEQARRRCVDLEHVNFGTSKLPAEAPSGPFDFVLLSEVCYYWSADDLERAKNALISACSLKAEFLLVHWTPFVESYPLTGDAVHEAFMQDERFTHLYGHRAERYRLDHFILRSR
jgi:SAM-dependent methyltransferase